MIQTSRVVFAKEVVDMLRDRRSLSTMLLTSIFMGPLTLLLLAHFVETIEQKGSARYVYVDQKPGAEPLVNFLERGSIDVRTPPTDYEAKIRSGDFQEAVIVPPADLTRRLATGEKAAVRVLYDDSRSEAQGSARRAEALVNGYTRELTALRLVERGLAPTLLRPITLDRVDTATPQQQGAALLFIIPMVVMLAGVVGSLSAAIDSTAGERERGSLEPLLMNPVDVHALVLGKWAAVALQAAAVSLLTLGSFSITIHLFAGEAVASLFQFGSAEALRFALLILPFAAMIAAVLMLLTSFGRTHKEAQTYAGYLTLVINFVPLITLLAGLRLAAWQRFVPALGQQVLMARVLRGEPLSWPDYTVPAAVALGLIVLALLALARLLREERVVFGR